MKSKYTNAFEGASFIKATQNHSEYTFNDPIPLFRRVFDINEEIESAEISVQSPGFATYYINGELITEDKFISATSDYTKILWYNSYDVTHLLKKGKNKGRNRQCQAIMTFQEQNLQRM